MSLVEQAKNELAQRILTKKIKKKPVADRSESSIETTTASRIPKRLSDHPGIAESQELYALAKKYGMNMEGGGYFVPQRNIGNGRALTDEGQEMINFSSYDYLGLSNSKIVREMATDAIQTYGTTASAARVVGGEVSVHKQFETEIAEFSGAESALLFVSGYLTNLSFLGYVVGKADLVIHDELSHNSMITGARLSGAKRLSFKHNDPEHLENMLKQHRHTAEVCLVLLEGVYSMDGDIVCLPDILDVVRRYNCDLFIDEAHSFGVLGKTGRGVFEHFDIPYTNDVVLMNTISKSLASVGGYVAGNKPLIDAVKYQAPGASLYVAAIAPAQAAASLASLREMTKHPELTDQVRSNAKLFADRLTELGLDIGLASGSAIVPILTRGSVRALKLSSMLRRRNIIAYAVGYPVVPEDMARIRFFVSAAHREEDLIQAANVVYECAKVLGIVKIN